MTPPRRFRAGQMLDAGAIRAAAEAHPRLRTFMRTVGEHSEHGDRRAGALMEHIIRRIVDDLGDLHLGNATARLEHIQVLRDNIAAILDHVLEGGDLPEGVRIETLEEYFDQLNHEMRELSGPRDAIIGDEPLRLHDDAAAYADTLMREFEAADGAAGGHTEPSAAVNDAFRALPADQQAAMRKAAAIDATGVWNRVSAESEAGVQRSRAALDSSLAGRLTPDEMTRLHAALDRLGEARNRGLQVSAARLSQALEHIADLDLRAVVAASGDVWILSQLAMHNPQALTAMWEGFRRNGGGAADAGGFRAHVRHEMVTYGRGVVGEYTAAFSLSSIEMFLKGPDTNVRVRGTDLVGIGHDGWLWLIDDKSHRTTSVSSVTALTDNLATNLRRDAGDFRTAMDDLRRQDPGFVPDPRVLDAVQRMEDAAGEVDRINRTGPAETRPARIRQALADRKLRMRVTSAAGQVTEITQALRDIGLAVEPTRATVPWPNPGGG